MWSFLRIELYGSLLGVVCGCRGRLQGLIQPMLDNLFSCLISVSYLTSGFASSKKKTTYLDYTFYVLSCCQCYSCFAVWPCAISMECWCLDDRFSLTILMSDLNLLVAFHREKSEHVELNKSYVTIILHSVIEMIIRVQESTSVLCW